MNIKEAVMDASKFRVIIGLILILIITTACGTTTSGNDSQATLDVMSTSILQTATEAAKGEEGTGSSAVMTAQAEATQQSEKIALTQTAIAESEDIQQATQAEAAAPVIAEIPLYGLSSASGRLGWVHDPVTLEVEGYQQSAIANDYLGITASDFAIAADITWDTQYGSSGCGYMFRSDGDENKPNQYNILISRAGLGHAVFVAVADGELANYKVFYIREEDRSFDAQNGATNRLVVVAVDTILEIFTNGVKVGEVDITQPPQQPATPPKPTQPPDLDDDNVLAQYNAQLQEYEEFVQSLQENYATASINFEEKDAVFEEGFLAFIALSESGKTRCDYSDAWLWLIDEE